MYTTKHPISLSIIALLFLLTPVFGQEGQDLVALFQTYEKALHAQDLDTWLSYHTPDAVLDFPAGHVVLEGREQIRGFLQGLFDGFPDVYFTEGRVLGAGNIVMVEHIFGGTHLETWNGIPPTGNPVQVPHVDIYEFEGDKIKRVTIYLDMAGVMVQLGVLPPPEMDPLVPSFALPDAEPTGLPALAASREAFARWNSHDMVHYAKMLHPDFKIFAGPLGAELDRNGWVAMSEMYFQTFTGTRAEIIREVDMGDGWIMTETIASGLHEGPFLGVPPTGRHTAVRQVVLQHYDANGLLSEQAHYFDNLTLLAQITPECPPTPPIPEGYVQDEITSPSLEGNLLGDPATRSLLVHLPASYNTSPEKHYPTIYLLHGFLGDHTYFTSAGVYNVFAKAVAGMDLGADVDSVVTELTVSGRIGEAIIVMPDAINSFGGSIYECSPLIGDYRSYIAKDLVAYIDGKYRTIADRNHRGIAGHSMGGYGAISLAIQYPDVFGAVAAMSPWLCDLAVQPTEVEQAFAEFPLVQGLPTMVSTREDLWNIVLTRGETNQIYALAAAWTPNFNKPPFYLDLPMKYPDKTVVPEVWNQWLERGLNRQIERDGKNLAGTPVFIDEGRGPALLYPELVGIQSLLKALYDQGISYTYNAFDGDHLTHLRDQLASALMFLYPHIASEIE